VQAELIRLLIVEHQPVVTPELRARLGREPDFGVVGRVGSAAEATRLLRDQPIDMVLVESTLPEPGAVELTRFFRVRQSPTVVVFVTRVASQLELFEAARAGAAAYVRASIDPDLFIATLRRAARGEFPIDDEVVRFPAVATQILAHFRQPPAPAAPVEEQPASSQALGPLFVKLSAREIEILDLVARGNSNKLIARRLGISDQTVKNHLSAILRKLEVNDRTEAVVYALRNGWIRLDGGGAASGGPGTGLAASSGQADARGG
jgi:DNA-binding NarL/FixJ family response regulator